MPLLFMCCCCFATSCDSTFPRFNFASSSSSSLIFLPSSTTVRDLEKDFKRYGKIADVWIARNPPGFAFVDYEDDRDARDAVRDMNGRTILDRRIKVEISRRGRTGRGDKGGGNNAGNDNDRRYDRNNDRNYGRDRSRSRSRDRRGGPRDDRRGGRSRSRDRRDNRDRPRQQQQSRANNNRPVAVRTEHRLTLIGLPVEGEAGFPVDWRELKAFVRQHVSHSMLCQLCCIFDLVLLLMLVRLLQLLYSSSCRPHM